jgi:molybdopterin-containing oxidoreductase family iron-sulfur binding subunit
MKPDDSMTQKKYWSSLEDKALQDAGQSVKTDEFAEPLPLGEGAGEGVTRRDFLKLMGFGVAAVSAAACSHMPVQKAVPYLSKPEEITPGEALWYASTCAACPASCGILVKTREGRPIKIEGNPDSPLNKGGLCAVGQASVLDLYDSGRVQHPLLDGKVVSWAAVDSAIRSGLGSAKAVRVLSSTIVSPTTQKAIETFLTKFPGAKHVVYEALSVSALLSAHEVAFGSATLPHVKLDQADLLVGIGADFLGTWLSPVEFTKAFSSRRDPDKKMSRHIQVETGMSLTGANADERIIVKPSQVGPFVAAIYAQLTGAKVATSLSNAKILKQAASVAAELKAARGRAVVLCGSDDVDVQNVVLAINRFIGAYGSILDLAHPSYQRAGRDAELDILLSEIDSGSVDALIVYGANPVYDLPQGERLAAAIKKLPVSIAITGHLDETADIVKAVCPDRHFLESWNDAQPVAGLLHLTQPSIRPVYDSRQGQESLLKWAGVDGEYADYLKANWQQSFFPLQSREIFFDSFWTKVVQLGVMTYTTQLPAGAGRELDSASLARAAAKTASGLEIQIVPSQALHAGASANNPWLQELPDPVTKMTWGNVACVAPAYARAKHLSEGDIVSVSVQGKSIEMPIYIQPGQADGTVVASLGYGRKLAGKVGNGVGQNLTPLIGWDGVRHFSRGSVQLTATGRKMALATTQRHHSLEGRPIARDTTLAKFLQNPKAAGEETKDDLVMLWKAHETVGHSWGMAINLNACTGCSGCVVGCQVENNVAVVGHDEVVNQREMHWIRMDRYFSGDEENPEVSFQPMMCQHCANAPCESVCPVVATVHSVDGLNQQVYNRCVGTRYCANNCPYKVRRFNWFDYAGNPEFDFNMNDATERMVLNPDVVVRSRGVMEKCSMCVQRIQEGKLAAKKAGRELKDSDIKTACQQSCPADAIYFGDMSDEQSSLAQMLKTNPRRYRVLSELNVNPAVNYLSKVRNKQG